RRVQREVARAHAVQAHVAREHLRRGALRAAVRAVVVAEVAEVGGVVDIGVAAAAAVLGVGGVLQLGEREAVVLDPEVDRCARPGGGGRSRPGPRWWSCRWWRR